MGGAWQGPYRARSLLKRRPSTRRQPLPDQIAALFASRYSCRDHLRQGKPVRQRGEPARRSSNEIRSAATAATRRKRAVDRRCLGTSRRIYPERRHKATLRRTLIFSTPLALRAHIPSELRVPKSRRCFSDGLKSVQWPSCNKLGGSVRQCRLSHFDDPQAAFLTRTVGPVDRRTGLHSDEAGAHERQH